MVSCSDFGLPMHAQLLRLFVTTWTTRRKHEPHTVNNKVARHSSIVMDGLLPRFASPHPGGRSDTQALPMPFLCLSTQGYAPTKTRGLCMKGPVEHDRCTPTTHCQMAIVRYLLFSTALHQGLCPLRTTSRACCLALTSKACNSNIATISPTTPPPSSVPIAHTP